MILSHILPGLLHTLQDHLSAPKINLVQDYTQASCFMNFYASIPAKAKPRCPLTPPCQGTPAHSTKPGVLCGASVTLRAHPWTRPHRSRGYLETRLVTKCPHSSICPFQRLFSHVHLRGGKKTQLPERSSQNIISSVKRHKDVWLQGFQPHRRSLLRKGSPLKMET